MIRVLIADDQALVRGAFRVVLDSEPDIEVVAEAVDGRDAIEQTQLRKPDVVLMDVRMPGVDGIEATRRLHATGSPAKVLMLTTFDLDEYFYEAMKAGASGFMLKNAPAEQLAIAVRTVATGEALLAPAITRRLIEAYVQHPFAGSSTPPQLGELTERELDVLREVARGLSNAEIAEELVPGREHRQDPHQPDPHQVRSPRPHTSRRPGIRDRPRSPWRRQPARINRGAHHALADHTDGGAAAP